MIVRKVTTTLAAISAIAAAAGVAVIAAAFALYALLRDYLGPSGSAAVVAAIAALGAALAGLILFAGSRGGPRRGAAGRRDDGLTSRAFDMARDKPMIAAGVAAAAAVAAIVIAVKNPKVVTAALTAFLAGRATPKS